ncbi:hypothetical protein M899_0130 [Bacteriovorax sp. BSW11_IV]|uniref:tetratricopeptide repeat protein n=1 Tax=Bacteriovorax sp. BSW11_IV TaxID=1353529 RepID=UPI000389E86F|nr:hypothetical protein [Bacteriovorax sp. BSW11_IV]EQC47077.1 hypothetical protein M899_0130 [Bacteriovorax sp. BSW11_IV]
MILKLKDYSLIFIVTFLFYVCFLINSKYTKPSLNVSFQDKAVNLNDDILNIFSLGQKRLISSLLWTKTMLDSDLEHYKKNDLNSWMFLRFNTITKLTPNFYEAYLYGGVYLSIVKDDILGARLLYEKGLDKYPNDSQLLLNFGFHLFHEEGKVDEALSIYEKLYSTNNYPPFLPILMARLKQNGGDLFGSYILLKNMLLNLEEDNHLYIRVSDRIKEIEFKMNELCLQGQTNFCIKKGGD